MQSKDYDRALQRAHDEELIITGSKQESGWEAIYVAHPEDLTGCYTVRYYTNALTLTCNCEAGSHGIYCKHRALVHEFLVTRKSSSQAA